MQAIKWVFTMTAYWISTGIALGVLVRYLLKKRRSTAAYKTLSAGSKQWLATLAKTQKGTK